MIIKIVCFANLKDYFNPRFAVNIAEGSTFKELSDHLKGLSAAAAPLIENCSFWVDDDLKKLTDTVIGPCEVCVLPNP